MKFTKEIKNRLVDLVYKDGMRIIDASRILNINYNSGRTCLKRFKEENYEFKEKKMGGNNILKLTPDVLGLIETIIENNPTLTLKKLSQVIFEETNLRLSLSSVNNALKKLRITLKRAGMILDRVNSIDTISKRKQYAGDFILNSPEDKYKCIFIDESGFNLHLRRSYARSSIGERVSIVVPTNRGRIITLIIAMNQEKIIHFKIIDRTTCNGDIFASFLQELLAKLRAEDRFNSSWIIMDNAAIHKVSAVRAQFEKSDYHLKFLSPYSYMLNPVEKVFSKIKTTIRNIINVNNVNESFNKIIEHGVATINTQDCFGYFIDMLRNAALSQDEHIFN